MLQCALSTTVTVERMWRDRDSIAKVSYRTALGIQLDLGGQAHFCMCKLQGKMKKKFQAKEMSKNLEKGKTVGDAACLPDDMPSYVIAESYTLNCTQNPPKPLTYLIPVMHLVNGYK